MPKSDENPLWANPCDYNDTNTKSQDVGRSVADFITFAKFTRTKLAGYKGTFAKLHSFDENYFDTLLLDWSSKEWLRDFPWFRQEILPPEKELYHEMPQEKIDAMKDKMDELLPPMYKTLKAIVAGFYEFHNKGFNDNVITDESIKQDMNLIMHEIRALLCIFFDILKARKLCLLPLYNYEVPDFSGDLKLVDGLVMFRDTLNYLEYLIQVFNSNLEISS